MVSRIRDRIGMLELESLAHMGRQGIVEGTLSWWSTLISSSIASTMPAAR